MEMDTINESLIATWRKEFPILHQQIGSYPLVYLDNAATTQKPSAVIESIDSYYKNYNANIHRGAHYLAHKATEAFENTREKIRAFIHAKETAEIIFTSGTTQSINLVAQSWGRKNLQVGDEIILSEMDHHSNIVPWQMISEERGAVIRVIPVTDAGEWDIDAAKKLFNAKTKVVAVNHVSNALGTINPIREMIALAHAHNAIALIDGAQAVAHFDVDVRDLDSDFYCFSGHKVYGPTGTGILYGKRGLLESMPPYQGGGEMIKTVSFSGTTYNELPHKFEAGTPHIAGFIGLGAAIDFVNSLDKETVARHEEELLVYATKALLEIEGLRIYGTSSNKIAVLSFSVEGIHPYDLGTLLDKQGIAVRTGHHCTEPLWNRFGIPGTVRASFAFYNTFEEIDRFVTALQKSLQLLRS
ncbi:MAG: aminotransferase class V-fold PLP-dependent enzyme [Flavobacteriales bacterium]